MPRHDTEVLSRRTEVARRYLQGEMQEQIAQSFGVTQGQISQDLKAIRAAWLASAVRDFDALKAQELAKIDAVEREYWLACTLTFASGQIFPCVIPVQVRER